MDFFNFFQFVYVLLFLLIFAGRSIYLQMKGVRVFVIGKGKPIPKAILEAFFIIIFFFWIFEQLRASLHLEMQFFDWGVTSVLINKIGLKIAGVALLVAGMSVFIWALLSFRKSWRIGIDTQNAGDLITNGVFSFSRNPVFVFINMYFIGTALIYPTWFFIIIAAMAIAGIHLQILNEEKFLRQQYGKSYVNYSKKVRRYF